MKHIPVPAIILFGLFIVFSYGCRAADIYLNEIVIDRGPQAVELWNNASSSADISGWYIDDSGGTTYFTVPQNTFLYGNSCAVFESDFNLNKTTADTARLFDATAPPTSGNAVLVDSYAYKSGPGNNNSYSRSPDATANWVTATESLGRSNSTGASCVIVPTAIPSPSPEPTAQPSPTAEPAPSILPQPSETPLPDYSHIYINEAFPYPPSGEKEWVELYSANDFDVSLIDWYIDDVENGGGTPRRFSASIPSHGYAVVEMSSLLNNDKDSVRLLDENKTQIDGFEYERPQSGKSLGRISFETESVCIEAPSRGIENTACIESPSIPPSPLPAVSAGSSYGTGPVTVPYSANPFQNRPRNIQLPAVLGESTDYSSAPDQPPPADTSPVRYMTIVSGSYAILTIVSLLFKIRNGLTA